MNKIAKISAISLIVVGVAATAFNASASWGEYRDQCKNGAQGFGPGAAMMKHKGNHGHFADRDLDLSMDEVRTLMEARMIMHGNDRLKVGQIQQKDDKTYLVDVVTLDNSLVKQVEIGRDSGFPRGPFGFGK